MAVKPVWMATAADINGIEYVIRENLKKGSTVDLRIGLDSPMTPDQLVNFEDYLVAGGLQMTAPVKMVSSPWPNTVELQFKNVAKEGVGFAWTIALLVIGGLAFVGITSFIGYQIGEVIGQIAKYILPVSLILGVTYLLSKYIEKQQPAMRRPNG